MPNILPTTNLVAKEFLAILKNNIVFANNVNRDFESEFTGAVDRGYAPGQTINIKRPPRYGWRAGRVALPQDTVITTAPLTLSQGGTDLQFTSLERTLSITQFERIMEAGAAAVINEIDRQGLDLARRTVANTVGTVGSYPTTQAAAVALITQAQQKIDENAGPRNARKLVVSPAMNAAVVQGMSGMFNGSGRISQQNNSGMFVAGFGAEVEMDQNVSRHTNGTQAITGLTVVGAGQTGSTLTTSATGSITQGTVFTIANVFAVNPQSRQNTNSLQQFVVTADVPAGATSIPIFPAITPAGNFQTVTASPANNAAITFVGAANAGYETNILYHRDAFTLAMVPMYQPPAGAGAKVTQLSDDGFTVKVTQFYDGINDNNLMRLDVLFGFAATYPELGVKVIA